MKGKPFLFLLIFFISGIIFGSYIYIKNPFVHLFIIVDFIILLLLSRLNLIKPLFIISTLLIYISIGILSINSSLRPTLKENNIINYVSNEKLSIEGILYRSPEYAADGFRLYIKAIRIYKEDKLIHVSGNILIYLKDERISLRYGDRIRILVR